mgnify:CR=1 FL=1
MEASEYGGYSGYGGAISAYSADLPSIARRFLYFPLYFFVVPHTRNPGTLVFQRSGVSIPVRAGGVEPPRAYTHCHLKTARLPFRHARRQSTNLHLFTPSNKSACRDWRTSTKRPHQTACSALYCVPQSFIASMIGCSVRPVSVSEYSTRGGTSGYTSRCTNPSRSI